MTRKHVSDTLLMLIAMYARGDGRCVEYLTMLWEYRIENGMKLLPEKGYTAVTRKISRHLPHSTFRRHDTKFYGFLSMSCYEAGVDIESVLTGAEYASKAAVAE